MVGPLASSLTGTDLPKESVTYPLIRIRYQTYIQSTVSHLNNDEINHLHKEISVDVSIV